MQQSYFDGGLFELVIYRIIGFFLTTFTLGLAFPWAMCLVYGWEINHTVIDGKRLRFDGTGAELFGNWIKWLLLTFITLGIYGFWVGISIKKWQVKHTYFID